MNNIFQTDKEKTLKKAKQENFIFAGKKLIDEYDRALESNRTLLYLTVLFIFLTFLSWLGYYSLSNKITVEVSMPGYEKVRITQVDANKQYFRLWGEYLVRNASNFDRDNIADRLAEATQLMKKSRYLDEKIKFEKFIIGVKTNAIEQKFIFDMSPNKSGVKKLGTGQVKFFQKGTAEQKIGKNFKTKKECEYSVILYIEEGKLYEDGITTNCFSGDTASIS